MNSLKYAGMVVASLFLSLLVTACGAAPPAPRHRPDITALARLESVENFRQLQGEPLSGKFNTVQSVKVVYEVQRGRLYYVNSPRYRYHYTFCTEVLGYSRPLETFNTDNYGSRAGREYYLANLNYYVQSGVYALEFVSDDQISAAQIKTLYDAVYHSSYIKDSLRVLVSTGYIAAMAEGGKLPLPQINASDIYSGQHYQPLNGGVAYGILRLFPDAGKDPEAAGSGDIVILKGTPLYVPACAGIITDANQTPLSHINILCHSRNIPSASEQRIWGNRQVLALAGKPVRLQVGNDSLVVEEISRETLAAHSRTGQDQKLKVLKYSTVPQHLVAINNIGLDDAVSLGNKASGMGELYKVAHRNKSSFSVPEGAFAIPFSFYKKHISDPAIEEQIALLLDNPAMQADKKACAAQLKRIRKAIKEAPLDAGLLQEIGQMIRSNNAGTSYRFRSSSNAEDKSGFSGAGLYDSKTGILGDTAKGVERAVKAVWASTWDEAPFAERSFYHIDHRSAMMGVLCHRNFPDEAANGVAITRNLYRPGFPGFTVNVQQGEVSVVSPPEGVSCEQFVCINAGLINPENQDVTTDYLTYSSLTGGKPVLSPRQITQLYHALRDVKSHFFWSPLQRVNEEYDDYALDIEFKFDRNGKLYLKQARPYR